MSKSITLVLYLDTLGLHFGYHECFKISTLATCERIIGPAEKMQETKGYVLDLGKVFLVKISEKRSRLGILPPCAQRGFKQNGSTESFCVAIDQVYVDLACESFCVAIDQENVGLTCNVRVLHGSMPKFNCAWAYNCQGLNV